MVLVVIQGVLPLLSLYLLKLMVDAVESGLGASDPEAMFRHVGWLIVLATAVALVAVCFRSAGTLVGEAQGQIVTDHVQDMLHAKSIELDLEYYESPQYYDALHRAQQEAPHRPVRILSNLLSIGQNGISLMAIVGLFIFSLHWGFALILIVAALPGVVVRLWFADRIYQWKRQRTSTERRVRYLDWLLTGDWHAKENRLFGLGPLFKRQSKKLRRQLRREQLKISSRRAMAEWLAQTSQVLAIYGSFGFLAYQTMQGDHTLGDLVMYYQAFQRGQQFLRQIMTGFAGLYENSLFLSDFYRFLSLKPKVVEPASPQPVPCPIQAGITFDRVTFRYPAGIKNVLEEITLTIRPGEHVAFVGENGAGKTTLVKLLCRLYDPTAGSIRVDGTELQRFQTTALRNEIGIVFQDYARYNLTARENIWLGDIKLPADHPKIRAAAVYAGADEVIAKLRHGYDTVLGKIFEQGEELSTGQWQKVALARAFLREAQIIVLDEPSSALDPEAEYQVFKQFDKLAAGRTAILISHRLSTVKMADRIYVLKDGRIVESGTHDELVDRNGTYAHLFETQAQHYR